MSTTNSQSLPRNSQSLPIHNMPVSVWGVTNKGREREGNEDSVYPQSGTDTSEFRPRPENLNHKGYLLIVADGIGGTQAGRQASQWAVRVATERYYELPGPDLEADLKAAVEYANASLHQYLQSMGQQKAGSTMVAAVIHRNMLYVANVGDSRAYLIHDGEISQLTTDHTLTQQKIDRGLIRPEQAEMDPERSVLTRSLGTEALVKVDLLSPPKQLTNGDTVLLCSDGLPDMLSNSQIGELATKGSSKQAAARLIAAANQEGGYDNISVVLARIGETASSNGAGALWTNLERLSQWQKILLMIMAAAMVILLCGLLGWVMYEIVMEAQATPPPTATPPVTSHAITPTAHPVTTPTAAATQEQSGTVATVTLVPTFTPTPTNTPRPTRTKTPSPTPITPTATIGTPQCNQVCETCTRTITDPVTGATTTEQYECNCHCE